MIGGFELEQGIATMPPTDSLLVLILMALFALTCGSFAYTNRGLTKIWAYLHNHLSDKVKQLVQEELKK